MQTGHLTRAMDSDRPKKQGGRVMAHPVRQKIKESLCRKAQIEINAALVGVVKKLRIVAS